MNLYWCWFSWHILATFLAIFPIAYHQLFSNNISPLFDKPRSLCQVFLNVIFSTPGSSWTGFSSHKSPLTNIYFYLNIFHLNHKILGFYRSWLQISQPVKFSIHLVKILCFRPFRWYLKRSKLIWQKMLMNLGMSMRLMIDVIDLSDLTDYHVDW